MLVENICIFTRRVLHFESILRAINVSCYVWLGTEKTVIKIFTEKDKNPANTKHIIIEEEINTTTSLEWK